MMDELDAQVDLAENFLRAGNHNRAETLCREVLEKRHDDLGAFLCLFDIHLEKDKLKDALELCDWRLARRPECPQSHLCKLIAYGTLSAQEVTYDHIRRIKGDNLMSKTRVRLANHPLFLARAEILYSVYFLDPQEAFQQIDIERQKGQLDSVWLDSIESRLQVHTRHTSVARHSVMKRLAENPHDADTLHDMSLVSFFSGRLPSAIKYARRAKQFAPEQSAINQEVIIASIIGLIPIFWIGQIIITLTLFITRNLEEYAATPLRFGGVLATVMSYVAIFSRFTNIQTTTNYYVLAALLCVAAWAGYIIFYFGDIGHKISGQEKSIKLSKKY